ncbi:hypothetical protein [Sulfitobacter sp. R18_1]|uniref:hypothetical protein n=1 Tax=Sulfitobacter sp. R18_1 TaxID=2821104 RepID=UPI001ADBB983|nr:hypothetical protein [Sulfitobacter sp. R18_1]MBO9428127.1 hypothetical protein [Sulfitobacter sp. R18_1]
MSFEIAGHKIPEQCGLTAAFGADMNAYPPLDAMPEEYQRGRADGCKIASSLFYGGGKMSDFGRVVKEGVDNTQFLLTLRSLLSSFAPKHEQKMAAAGLLIDTYTVKLNS